MRSSCNTHRCNVNEGHFVIIIKWRKSHFLKKAEAYYGDINEQKHGVIINENPNIFFL